MTLILKNIKSAIEDTDAVAIEKARKKLAKQGIRAKELTVSKKSVDARNKNDIFYICSVIASVDGDQITERALAELDADVKKEEELTFERGSEPLMRRPLVVGFGPAGMFASLMLAERGYAPVILERGGSIAERVKAVESFYRDALLNEDCNIQFGAGGAGTFSDGKLVTRINEPRCSYVLERLVEFGAPREILTNAKPHIGTDLLRGVCERIADRLTELGAEIRYNTKFVGYEKRDGIFRVSTDKGELEAGVIVLAIGHSARDTYRYLIGKGLTITPKAFSAGVRIEHLREDINRAMYGRFAERLPAAEYQLSKRVGERGVYTFCMCPGGEVVAGASECGGVVVNGMSHHARNGVNSNSALAVSVLPEDYGSSPEKAIEFQRMLERAAFNAGGGNYTAPVSSVGDFLSGKGPSGLGKIKPTYMNGRVRECDLAALMPSFMTEMLRIGIADFGKKIKGFDRADAVLTGFETRTSAPIRIERGNDMCALLNDGVYPCGEGAGYAGGITSAAIDGIRCAQAITAKYKETN